MKKLIFLSSCMFLSFSVFSQAPASFSFQAVMRNASNELLVNEQIDLNVRILQGSAEGPSVYEENHVLTTNSNGLFSAEIGAGNTVSGTLTAIDWSRGPYFMATEASPKTPGSSPIRGVTQLLSVPYALHAGTADRVLNGSPASSHYVGEQFGGGIVFHTWRDIHGTEHGLVVSLRDVSRAAKWAGGVGVKVGEKAQSGWDGRTNSAEIARRTGGQSAAALCMQSGAEGDWYLPSVHELGLLFKNMHAISDGLRQIPGAEPIKAERYWSSTELSGTEAYLFDMQTGQPESRDKAAWSINVRAIRTF